MLPSSGSCGPCLDKLCDRAGTGPGRLSPVPVSMTRHVAGAELGLVLGWMSSRVLGQYDQLLIEEENPEDQDLVYYVGPNIVGVERKLRVPPRPSSGCGSPSTRSPIGRSSPGCPGCGTISSAWSSGPWTGVDPDPNGCWTALRRAPRASGPGTTRSKRAACSTLLATPEQFAAIQEVGGMMSLLEGHGDVTMDRAAPKRIPNAPTFSRTLHERRQQRGLAKLMSVLLGLDAKMRQYEQGERFIEAVETAGGRTLFDRVWEGPEWLPSWEEIREPQQWIGRARADRPAAASG